MASCRRSLPPQNSSLPKVSYLKIFLPALSISFECRSILESNEGSGACWASAAGFVSTLWGFETHAAVAPARRTTVRPSGFNRLVMAFTPWLGSTVAERSEEHTSELQ